MDGRGSQNLAHLINASYTPAGAGKRRATRRGPDLNVQMRGGSRGLNTYAALTAIRRGVELRVDYGKEYWDRYGQGSKYWGVDIPSAGDWVKDGKVYAEDAQPPPISITNMPNGEPPPSLPPSPPASPLHEGMYMYDQGWDNEQEWDIDDLVHQDLWEVNQHEQIPATEDRIDPDADPARGINGHGNAYE